MTNKVLGFSCAAFAVYLLWGLPYVPGLREHNPETTSLIQRRMRQADEKGKTFKPRMAWRNLNAISPNLIHAVLLAEDDTFYQHHGFDLEQIKIAVEINWKKKKFAYGGSTLTQQLARTLYLSPSKNVFRKFKEALLTLWFEQALSKKRILELYLNVAEWGDGIFGAEAAAQHYYGKSCADLSAEEAVSLASILPSPRKWSPSRVTPFMQKRRSGLLARMPGWAPAVTVSSAPAVSISSAPAPSIELPEEEEEETEPAE